jgi:hypothetical protein
MRRVSLETLVLFIPSATLLCFLTQVATVYYEYKPPRFVHLPLVTLSLASPAIAFFVIFMALVLRWTGALRLKHPYVLTGLALACLNLLLAALIVVWVFVALKSMNGIIMG